MNYSKILCVGGRGRGTITCLFPEFDWHPKLEKVSSTAADSEVAESSPGEDGDSRGFLSQYRSKAFKIEGS